MKSLSSKPCASAQRFAVIILAAGASSRMGRPKLLLPWGESSVLGHLLRVWGELGPSQITVVCAANDTGLTAELDRLRHSPDQRIVNSSPQEGMFSSIRCAARWGGWHPGLTHWMLVLGDQPQIKAETLRGLVQFAAEHPLHICQPVRAGCRRHPICLPASAFFALRDTEAPDLREFLASRAANRLTYDADDPGLDLDLDYPEDYTRASALMAAGQHLMPPLISPIPPIPLNP